MKIYHNPRCRKSRQTLSILQDAGIEPEIIRYLEDTPDRDELMSLINKLGIHPEELVRKNEKIYKEKFSNKDLNHDEWIDAMVHNPKLIQRPIVVKGDRAVIGRPPESVKTLV